VTLHSNYSDLVTVQGLFSQYRVRLKAKQKTTEGEEKKYYTLTH